MLYGGKTGKVPYSWRVAILPYIEQQELYNAYNFDEPWDGPHNRMLIDKMPATYSYPGQDGTPASRSKTVVLRLHGPHDRIIFRPSSGARSRTGRAANPAVHRWDLEYDPDRRGAARHPLDQARGHPLRPERSPARAGRFHA